MGEPQREQRRIFLKTVEAYLLKPYEWGGQGFDAVDCSGLVVEGLRAAGLIGDKEDIFADGLWRKYRDKYTVPRPRSGCLIFWFRNNRAVHIAVGIGTYHCIGAHGGDSSVKTEDDADKREAFVKIRPTNYRGETFRCLDLFS